MTMNIREEKYSRRHYQTAYNTSIFSISLVLFMLGLFLLLIFQSRNLSAYFRENIAVSVLLKNDASAEEVLTFKKQLKAQDFVKSSNYISKQQAAEMLMAELGEDFVAFIGFNPLPPTFEVFLYENFTYPGRIEKVEAWLLSQELVDHVSFQKALISRLEKNISSVSRWLIILSFLLLIISVLLIHNTIRLDIYSRRLLIKSMMLVGATHQYIRRPFIRRGIKQGITSGIIAVLLLAALVLVVQTKLPAAKVLNEPLTLALTAILMLISGLIISWISNFIAVKKYLKVDSEDLY